MVSNVDLIQFYRCKSLKDLMIRAADVLDTIGFRHVSLQWIPAPTSKAAIPANHEIIWDNFEAQLGADGAAIRQAFVNTTWESLARAKKNTIRCQNWKMSQTDVFRIDKDAPEPFELTRLQFGLPRDFNQPSWTEFVSSPLCRERDRTLMILAKTQDVASPPRCIAGGQTVSVFASAYRSLHSRLEDYPRRSQAQGQKALLSCREIECLQWLAQGKTLSEAATILDISERTLRFHICNARERLGVATTMQAVVAAALIYGFDPNDSRRSIYTAIRSPQRFSLQNT